MLFFAGGFQNIFNLIHNINTFVVSNNGANEASGLNLSISNMVMLIVDFIRRHYHILSFHTGILLGKVATVAALMIGVVVFFSIEKRWKQKMCLSLLCILIPGVSYLYTLIFLMIPLLEFLANTSDINDRSSLFPAILFGVLFSFITIPIQSARTWYPVTASFLIIQFFLILFSFYLVIGVLKNYYVNHFQNSAFSRDNV
jgi:glucose-6-phosphate-specific signal transduction histidine kinase